MTLSLSGLVSLKLSTTGPKELESAGKISVAKSLWGKENSKTNINNVSRAIFSLRKLNF